jgi:hypothetical protein
LIFPSCRYRYPEFRGIFHPGVSGNRNSAEFFVPESLATKIPWNFPSRSLWQQKFRGIFRPGVSGNRNSAEFFIYFLQTATSRSFHPAGNCKLPRVPSLFENSAQRRYIPLIMGTLRQVMLPQGIRSLSVEKFITENFTGTHDRRDAAHR